MHTELLVFLPDFLYFGMHHFVRTWDAYTFVQNKYIHFKCTLYTVWKRTLFMTLYMSFIQYNIHNTSLKKLAQQPQSSLMPAWYLL